ncbi:MAG: hypothetical protein Kow006_17450 [Gammaproteobacteria bacterium]
MRRMGGVVLGVFLAAGGDAVADSALPDLWIEQSVEPVDPYVQQQVLVTTTLYRRDSLLTGYFVAEESQGFRQLFLDESGPESVVVKNENFERIRYRQALFPQRSGKLALPAVAYSGRESFARSKPKFLEVQSRPIEVGGWWLPARAVTLTQSWEYRPASPSVGDILLRTLRLEVEGASGAQLPVLEWPDEPAWTVQRTSVRVGTDVEGERVTGWREERWRLVPNREGRQRLPALSVAWWDTGQDRARTAELPEEWLVVRGGVAPAEAVASADLPAGRGERGIPWRESAPLLSVMIVVSGLFLLGYRQRRAAWNWVRRRGLWWGFAHACGANQAQLAWRRLREWEMTVGDSKPLASPLSWARRCEDRGMSTALRELDAALYRPSGADWRGRELLIAARRYRRRQRRARTGRKVFARLPTLEPPSPPRFD